MFFKAVVQAVLLDGSETRVLTMARKNRPKKNDQTGEWKYPDQTELFREVGLRRRERLLGHILQGSPDY